MSLDLSCSRMSTDLSHVRDFHFSRLLEEAARGAGVGHAFHDVNFRILDEEGRLAGQVRAHKMVLSLVSEMFRAQFTGSFAELGPQGEDKGVTQVEVRDTSVEAFKAMIRYIYTGFKWDVNFGNDLDLLFQMLCLADRFLLGELTRLMRYKIEVFPVSCQTYAAVFKNCDRYQHLLGFETLCADLRDRCALTILKVVCCRSGSARIRMFLGLLDRVSDQYSFDTDPDVAF